MPYSSFFLGAKPGTVFGLRMIPHAQGHNKNPPERVFSLDSGNKLATVKHLHYWLVLIGQASRSPFREYQPVFAV